MANYLPFYFNTEKRPILIFGGGSKAFEKIQKLLPYGAVLTVAAEKVTPSIKKLGEDKKISLVRSNGTNARALISRLHPWLVVITDADHDMTKSIFKICMQIGVDVHTVGAKEYSTVLFPSVIQRKHLSVAVSTFGESPAAAKWILDHIEQALPAFIDGMLGHFGEIRQKLTEKASFAPGQFAAIYGDIFNAALSENRMLSPVEMAQIMGKYIDEAK